MAVTGTPGRKIRGFLFLTIQLFNCSTAQLFNSQTVPYGGQSLRDRAVPEPSRRESTGVELRAEPLLGRIGALRNGTEWTIPLCRCICAGPSSCPPYADCGKMVMLSGEAVPEQEVTDAVHIATAAVYGMDVLLTLNCRHMANPVTLPVTASIIARAGYRCPIIITPGDFLDRKEEFGL